MANEEHIDIAKKGKDEICERRIAHPHEVFDLSGAELPKANLVDADLAGANLSGANLSGADLSSANLFGADLSGADLSFTLLQHALLCQADLRDAVLAGAQISFADMTGADCRGADFRYAVLNGSEVGADFRGADLFRAELGDDSPTISGMALREHAEFRGVHRLSDEEVEAGMRIAVERLERSTVTHDLNAPQRSTVSGILLTFPH